MNIFFITSQFPPINGGIALAAHRVIKQLHEQGHSIRVLTRDPQDKAKAGFGETHYQKVNNIEVCYVPDRYLGPSAFGFTLMTLPTIFSDFQADLVHCYNAQTAGYFGVIYAKSKKIPLVVSCRGDDLTQGSIDHPLLLKEILSAADHVITVSNSLKVWAERLTDESKITVVKNTISPEFGKDSVRLCAEFRKQNGLLESDLVLGALFEERWKKGSDYLIQLLEDLIRCELPPFTFILAGRFESRLKEQINLIFEKSKNKNPGRRLILIEDPNRNQIPKIISSMNLFLLTSKREGMPNTLLEALCCGVPIAATAVDGCLDIIEGNNIGISIDPYDPTKGAVAIQNTIKDSLLFKEWKNNSKRLIQEEYNPQTELDLILNTYNSVMNS